MHKSLTFITMKKDTSKDAVNSRLQELREEFAKGQEVQKDLQRQMTQLTESMLRISGAIQVLEELQGAPQDHAEVAQ
jgi:chaperonin cofactor prefoldin